MKIKNNKGSITLFVLVAMIFFLVIAMSAYIYTTNKLQGQIDEIEQIKAAYEQDISPERLAEIYERYEKNLSE